MVAQVSEAVAQSDSQKINMILNLLFTMQKNVSDLKNKFDNIQICKICKKSDSEKFNSDMKIESCISSMQIPVPPPKNNINIIKLKPIEGFASKTMITESALAPQH